MTSSVSKSVIVAGGVGGAVEILDPGMTDWRFGPELPIPALIQGSMVQDPRGGVILVGGRSVDFLPVILDTLLRLQHTGVGANWEVMDVQLKTPRFSHVAMFVPDFVVNCTRVAI